MTTTIDGVRYVTLTNRATGKQKLRVNEETAIPAEVLALVVAPPFLAEAATLPLFTCQDCARTFSARHLFGESDVPGSCRACSDAFFTCPDCAGFHHPDDAC